jgi:hypothetical protein
MEIKEKSLPVPRLPPSYGDTLRGALGMRCSENLGAAGGGSTMSPFRITCSLPRIIMGVHKSS